MTDDLRALLRARGDEVAVPRPDVDTVLRRGRTERTRRRAVTGVAALAVVVLVGGTAFAATEVWDGRGDDPAPVAPAELDGDGAPLDAEPGTLEAYAAWGAWAVGDEITVARETVTLDAAPEHVVLTAGGAVAQTRGDDAGLVLVRPDGEVEELSAAPGEAFVSGDLGSEHVAWMAARPAGEPAVLHVWDVETDEEVAAIEVVDPDTGRTAVLGDEVAVVPAVDGDTFSVDTGEDTFGGDWRAGTVRFAFTAFASARGGAGVYQEADGRWVVITENGVFVDLGADYADVVLGPDGLTAYATRTSSTDDGLTPGLVRIEDQTFSPIAAEGSQAAFTPGGNVVVSDGTGVTACHPREGCWSVELGIDAPEETLLLADVLVVG